MFAAPTTIYGRSVLDASKSLDLTGVSIGILTVVTKDTHVTADALADVLDAVLGDLAGQPGVGDGMARSANPSCARGR